MASNEGFLTDAQRERLEIASQKVEKGPSSPNSPKSPKSPSALVAEHLRVRAPSARHARRSYMGRFFKKEGAGGKDTWQKFFVTDCESYIDKNDPNYDSSEEPYVLVGTTGADPLDEFKKAIVSIIEEYFNTADVSVAASDLKELSSKEYYPYVIKRLVSMAMDRHDKEKEMASVLLSELYVDVISPEQIKDGFYMLIQSADDLAVDTPDAVDILALFLARAVVDDILPPAFLVRVKKALPESSVGSQVILAARKSYLSAPHHAELVLKRWGGTTHLTVDDAKKRIDDLLREYASSGDILEACRCIRELGVPFFHHEVVKRALTLAMETQTAESRISELLKEAAEQGLISSDQVLKGFSRLEEVLDDLTLDVPSAKASFQSLVQKAILGKWLDGSFLKTAEESEKVTKYKNEILTIIREYFLSNDIPKLIESLDGLCARQYNSIFVKKLITLAMDRKNREKEMASELISALHMEIFTTLDVVDGFVMLLEIAEDTALDVLDASNELALFLARAVIDDALATTNLEEISFRLPSKSSGRETLKMAQSLLAASDARERLLRCWGGGGTGWAAEDYQKKMMKLLEEYNRGGVVCIHELGMPYFHHEVVKKALVMAMEKNERMLDLLEECYSQGVININQMTKGFIRTKAVLRDLEIPNAGEKFGHYVELALSSNWLDSIV